MRRVHVLVIADVDAHVAEAVEEHEIAGRPELADRVVHGCCPKEEGAGSTGPGGLRLG
jgi:hypothetical protein